MSIFLSPPESFLSDARTIGLQLSDTELKKLGRYLELLLETNKQFNLTAITDPEQAWRRHLLESLSLLPHLGGAASVIDVGSGGGLPGLPLAIVRPDLRVALLEATGKKARFLQGVADDLELKHVEVINQRAEIVGQDRRYRQLFDVAVSRAVGPLNVLLEYMLPLVKVSGRVLAMKGAKAEAELEQAGDAMHILGAGEVEVYEALPGLEDDAVVVDLAKERPTPAKYPRRPGEPKLRPL